MNIETLVKLVSSDDAPHHRVCTIMDSLVVTISTITTGLIAWLLAIDPYSSEMKLTLLPLIGALITSGGMIMLNPNPETRRITIGRALFALFFGCLTPQLLSIVFPSTEALFSHPVFAIAGGGSSSIILFALSRPFTAKLYEKSDALAEAAIKRIEAQAMIDSSIREDAEKRD